MGLRGYKGRTEEALAMLRAKPEASNAEIGRALEGLSRQRIHQIRVSAGLPKPERQARKPASKRERKRRGACQDCKARPAKVRGRCEKCARRADPVFRESERLRRAERAKRAKDSPKILPGGRDKC